MLKLIKNRFMGISMDETVDQVTAMIFRQKHAYNFELLYLQRSYHEKDRFSGDLCFPGGHRQPNQTCVQTAIRETFEQTGIKLNEGHYIGTIDHIFTTIPGKSVIQGINKKQLEMGVVIFCLKRNEDIEIKLCQKEIRDYKWVDFNKVFLNGKKEDLKEWVVRKNENIALYYPAFNIGMDRYLWGLTFFATMVFINRINSIVQEVPQTKQKVKIDLDFYNQCMKHCKSLRIEGKKSPQEQQIFEEYREKYLQNRTKMIKPKM